PTVSWMSSCWAITSLVPTPSVDDARIGLRYLVVSRRNKPTKPPRSPVTSGRVVCFTFDLSSSTACSPAWMDTPASAYVNPRLRPARPAPATHSRRPVWAVASPPGAASALLRSVTCVTVLPFVFLPGKPHRKSDRAQLTGRPHRPAASYGRCGASPPPATTSGETSEDGDAAPSGSPVSGPEPTPAAQRPAPSRTCLPVRLPLGNSIGYSPSKHARHRRVFGCSVAAINSASETYPRESAPIDRRIPSTSRPLATSSARVAKSTP